MTDSPVSRPTAHPWHGVDHAENFPVASWLVPAALRPPIVAIYRFARTADDIADEGHATPEERRAALRSLDHALTVAAIGRPSGVEVVDALIEPMRAHRLDWAHLHDLLSAFIQDTEVCRYPDAAAIDDYARRSANPVGRLVLEVFASAGPSAGHRGPALDDAAVLHRSDQICTGLQRINFLQDIASDLDRDRIYIPLETLAARGVTESQFIDEIRAGRFTTATRSALRIEGERARDQMLGGAALVRDVPMRLGLELRAIVAGGLRILDRIEHVDYDVLSRRPRLGWGDAMPLLRRMTARMPFNAASC